VSGFLFFSGFFLSLSPEIGFLTVRISVEVTEKRRFWMVTFLALYRGSTIAEAQLVSVSTDQNLVSQVVEYLLADPHHSQAPQRDPVLRTLKEAENEALNQILEDAE
jgi:hypothetical protein